MPVHFSKIISTLPSPELKSSDFERGKERASAIKTITSNAQWALSIFQERVFGPVSKGTSGGPPVDPVRSVGPGGILCVDTPRMLGERVKAMGPRALHC